MPLLLSRLGSDNSLRNGLVACGMALTLSFSASPGLAQAETSESSEGNFSVTTLQVGTAADYIPFEFKEPGEDKIIGFDIDIATYIAQQLGLALQIQETDFEQLLPAVAAGELDFAIAAITPTLEREQTLDFSEPYYISRHAFVSRQSDPIRTLTDIVGKTVIVQRGSVQETALLQEVGTGLDVDVMAVATTHEMMRAIRELQADVAIVEELVAVAYLENNPTLIMDVLGELEPSPIAIAFPQGSPYVDSFNQIIADMEASGELAQLAKQWFTANP
ncbi:MAG: transporter substrate-binding domain-containing protein [Cyanobacteria bacterium J06649_4]